MSIIYVLGIWLLLSTLNKKLQCQFQSNLRFLIIVYKSTFLPSYMTIISFLWSILILIRGFRDKLKIMSNYFHCASSVVLNKTNDCRHA